jgi:hypothetical protein
MFSYINSIKKKAPVKEAFSGVKQSGLIKLIDLFKGSITKETRMTCPSIIVAPGFK